MPSIRVLVVILIVASAAPAGAAERLVWFGTYTGGKTGSEGIYVSRFDDATGAISAPVLAAAAKSPSFLALHPALPVLYAVSEVAERSTSRGLKPASCNSSSSRINPKP